VAGWLGAPQLGAVFLDWVYFGEPQVPTFHLGIAVLGTLAALVGIGAGYLLYRERRAVDPMERRLGPLWGVLQHRFYIDDFYMAAIVRPIRDRLSVAVYWSNQYILDAVVNGAAAVARRVARMTAWFDRNVIDGAVDAIGQITGDSGGLLKYLQSGNVQWYAISLFVGVLALAVIFINLT
jgi:NADH-quinone oxidoreductase subunit L